MQVVPQQQVQEDGLTVGVVTQSRRTQTSVEETEGSDTHTHTQNKLNRFVVNEQVQTSLSGSRRCQVCVERLVPAHGVELVEELVHAGVVIITLSSHQIQSSAVLRADLLQQVVRNLLSLEKKKNDFTFCSCTVQY